LNYDLWHCHKWARLLQNRHAKLALLETAIDKRDAAEALRLFSEIFNGVNAGKNTDPGMAGSLLYHMAMVTKMRTETRLLLHKLAQPEPNISEQLLRFFDEFAVDAIELTKPIAHVRAPQVKDYEAKELTSDEKIRIYNELLAKTRHVLQDIKLSAPDAKARLEALFNEWVQQIFNMRLWQEYETIRGYLVADNLARNVGLPALNSAMIAVKDQFGEETVNIALNVTLKVGLKREKLQSIMLSDHFIDNSMDIKRLSGSMQFLNCPVFGCYQHISKTLGITTEIGTLFCTQFCFSHAQAMLNTVLPFTFTLSQPKRLETHGSCMFNLNLGSVNTTDSSELFVPLVVSWNLTTRCNLKCSHCYINSSNSSFPEELTTEEGMALIDQIAEVSRPLLILSGGEPTLRGDLFELIKYGATKGLKMGLGSNGYFIDFDYARRLKEAGITTVSISLDSVLPEKHDDFRGVAGSWQKAVDAIKALRENDILVQVNTTVTLQNYNEIDNIMKLAEKLGVENFHLFFLVPTGRGVKMQDLSPAMYVEMIQKVFRDAAKHALNVRPSCAPQFMQIAEHMHIDMRQWIRGCIAGLYYCRIFANGDVTPCPYLPLKLGNIRDTPFRKIWFNSEVLQNLRNFDKLQGKCGRCEYRHLCGGCRARAYGLSGDFIDYCGDLHIPTTELHGNYLAEDPWCTYEPGSSAKKA
jgi:radical SAM protein with 4Fe4S-binding SPASM domain